MTVYPLGTNWVPCGVDEVELTSRAADFDSDRDGMPDAWEKAHGLNSGDASDGKALTPSGYTNLETYLHSLCSPA